MGFESPKILTVGERTLDGTLGLGRKRVQDALDVTGVAQPLSEPESDLRRAVRQIESRKNADQFEQLRQGQSRRKFILLVPAKVPDVKGVP